MTPSPSTKKSTQGQEQTGTFWNRVRTFLVVTMLTVLIWMIAESRMIQTRAINVQVMMTTSEDQLGTMNPGDSVVRINASETWTGSVTIEVEGSLASLDECERALSRRVELVVGGDIPSAVGTHEIDLGSVFAEHPSITSFGVSIRSLSQSTISVDVDQLASYELPIRVELPPGVQLERQALTVPTTASVLVPSQLGSRVESRELIASLSTRVIDELTPGRLEIIPSIAVSLPSSFDVSTQTAAPGWAPIINPNRAEVRLTIKTLTETTTIDRLPIQILLAPPEVGQWDVVLNPGNEDLVSIELVGPADSLESIRNGTQTPVAVVNLSFQDLERGITSKQVDLLRLPQGVRVESKLPEVGFTINRVESN